MSYYNTLGADGQNWNAWGKDVFDGGMDVLKAFLTAKYGSDTAQQVVQNPNSDSSQSFIMEFLQWQMMQNNNQQQLPQQQKDNTMLYVALGVGALALIMMMNNNNGSRRR